MILLLQGAVILALSRATRWLFLPLGQPPVVGEMVGGLMLGPSCFGWLMPHWSAALFASATLPSLNALSQIGLVLFMFLVGLRARFSDPGRPAAAGDRHQRHEHRCAVRAGRSAGGRGAQAACASRRRRVAL